MNQDEWQHEQEQLDAIDERRPIRHGELHGGGYGQRGVNSPIASERAAAHARIAASYHDGDIYDDGEGNPDHGCTPAEIAAPLTGPDLAKHVFDLGCALNRVIAESLRKDVA